MKKSLFFICLALLPIVGQGVSTDGMSGVGGNVLMTPQPKDVLIECFGGIYCPNTPDGHLFMNRLMTSYPSRIHCMSVHYGPYSLPHGEPGYMNFRTKEGEELGTTYNASFFPSGLVNRSNHEDLGGILLGRGQWDAASRSICQDTAPVNVWVKGVYEEANSTIHIDVELCYTAEVKAGSTTLSIALTQSQIVGPQIGTTEGSSGQYQHNHVLRAYITPLWGETIEENPVGQVIKRHYDYVLPKDINGILTDPRFTELIAFVSDAGSREVLNVESTDVDASSYEIPILISGVDENISWRLDMETGVLTLSGGSMKNYSNNYDKVGIYVTTAPWGVYNTYIKGVDIRPDVKSIGQYAFFGCSSLTSVTIPSSVTSIGERAFNACSSLTSVIMENPTPCNIGSYVFPSFTEGFKIFVPYGTADTYKLAENWSTYADYIVEMEQNEEDDMVELTDISTYNYTLYFPSTEVNTGTTSTLSLNLKNAAEDITAFQCDIYLPEGVEWASTIDKRGNKVLTQPTFNAETERTDETYHTITPVTQMSNGAYRVMCYSMQKEVFLDNDGAVLDIPVTISENMEDGDYSVVIKDIYLTDTKTNQHIVDEVISKLTVFSYTSGDVNADGLINITDIVSVISYILEDAPESFIFKAADVNEDGIINITDIVGIIDIILTDDAPANATLRRRVAALANALPSLTTLEIVPFGIEQGTTSATVTLDMLNPNDEFTAFECSIKLPEGIGWAYTTDRRGNIIYTQPTFNKAAERTDANYHTLSPVTKMSDGTYKVICYSMQKVEFLDAAGAILDLPLIFAEDLAEGIYEIEVKDIVLTRPNVTDVKPSDYKATVVVGKPAVKSATIYGDITADAIAMLNARLGANESLGSLDLSSAIAVDGTSAITTANPNAVIYVAEGMSVKNESNVVEGDVCANLVLTDGKPFGPAKTFTVKAGEYSRTLSADTYGTIVLPFTPDAETLKGYTFYELTGVETNALTFDEVSSPVAGKPYVVTSDGTATKMSAEAESAVVIEPAATEADGWTMTGTYESVVFTDADELASLYCISGNQFKQATSKLTMNPFRAYFVGDGSVNSITLRGDDGTTNIISLNSQSSILNSLLYDLQGRQVEHAEQGIYIQNGKKVLVK